MNDGMRVVATAGHVDHGKSTLLRALTGMEPDRYEEEQRRGLTIDLGFVWTTLPSGRGVAFVDVPGHIRFIRTMLAGVGAVEQCLFVVAATEGWMPQSEEHLRILELVGVTEGIVVLTKAGAVDGDLLDLAREEVGEHLRGTFLDRGPIIAVDSLSGQGLDEVRDAIDGLVGRAAPPPDRGRPRLWVDRAFAIRGAGAVVTGTLTGGPLAVGDDVEVRDLRGPVRAARVRGVHAHGEERSEVGPSTRVALNLSGVHHHELGRGHVVVRPGQWRATDVADVALRVLPGAPAAVSSRGALLGYVGTSEQPVRIRLLGGRQEIEPGEEGLARVRLAHPLPLLPGDRFVLRDSGRNRTVAGGEVLDVDPVLPPSRARPDRRVERVVEERGWITATELELLTGERRAATVGDWVVAPAALDATRRQVEEAVDGAGPLGLDPAVLDDRQRAALATLEDIGLVDGRLRRGGGADPLADHPWVAELEASPFRPPGPEGVDRAEVTALVRRGLVAECDGVYFSRAALEQARLAVAEQLADQPEGITVSGLRERLDTTRKWAMPLVSLLDAAGVTARRGDVRVAGPRLHRSLVDDLDS